MLHERVPNYPSPNASRKDSVVEQVPSRVYPDRDGESLIRTVALPSLVSPILEALDEAFGDESYNITWLCGFEREVLCIDNFGSPKPQVGYGT